MRVVRTACEPGRCRGKAVAARWRVTGGAGHETTTKGLTGHFLLPILTRIGNLRHGPWKVNLGGSGSNGRSEGCAAGEFPSRVNPWLDAVAAASGISGEVSFAAAADGECGACKLHAAGFLGG